MAAMKPPNLFYRGSSMQGTLKPGDKLTCEKAPYDQIKKGDLIIFSRNAGEKNDFIVHRVVVITPKGLVTRGDNCLASDQDLLIEKNIFGRVIQYDRQGKSHRAQNGRMGAFRAGLLRCRIRAIKLTGFFLRKPCLTVKKSGLIAKIWHPEIDVFQFETPAGPLVKYVRKGRTVAVCWTGKKRQWQRRPYSFVLNPEQNF